ncbi:MAG: hypothetical protein KDA37_07530 [Planctomycetales bacterium]|nr:hypothetical protein [Planctomycetales bacterium]
MAVRSRLGYTLAELVVSMAAATVLLTGLASALFLTIETFDEQPAAFAASRAAAVQEEVVRDLGRATSFSTLTADTATFTVPDEDNDGAEETLTYQYDSVAGELKCIRLGFTTTLLSGVTGSTFGSLPRTVTGSAATPTPYDTNDWGQRWATGVAYEGFAEAKLSTDGNSLAVPVPSGVASGDLLIAAIAIDSDSGDDPSLPAGWTEINVNRYFYNGYYYVTLSLWWKIAAPSEPSTYTFNWSLNQQAYGWMMRFTGHDPTDPINAFATAADYADDPPCPAVTTTVDNAMIVRLGSFDTTPITEDAPGVAGHTPITMDRSKSGSNSVAGGAAYVIQDAAGNSGTASFTTTGIEQYVTTTIAIAPE